MSGDGIVVELSNPFSCGETGHWIAEAEYGFCSRGVSTHSISGQPKVLIILTFLASARAVRNGMRRWWACKER